MILEEEIKAAESTAESTEGAIATEGEGEAGAEGGVVEKKSNKKIILAALLFVSVIVGGITVFILKGKKAEEAAQVVGGEKKIQEANLPIFTEMDEMIINLNTEGKNISFMKIKVTLEVKDKENLEVIKKLEPRIKDVMQVYLRELRPSEVQGSVGIYRLREEILLRINKVVYPAEIQDILFSNILVQ